MAWAEGRIDAHLVVALGERQELPVRKAEAPALFVVTGAVGDPIGAIRKRMQMRAELGKRHPRADGHAVADEMQRRAAQIDDPVAGRSLDPCFADVPFAGDVPVEHLRSRRNLAHLERRDLGEDP